MFLEERRQQILEYLNKNERVKVEFLASLFNVTKETIRTDLNALAAEKLVQRCHGGAMVLRRSLQSKLITETGDNFEVLLKRLQSQKKTGCQEKGKVMRGKVCILGSFNVDIVAKVARFPKGGESLLALGSTLGPGGKGANQATAVSRAGARVHFVSKVGQDPFSQSLLTITLPPLKFTPLRFISRKPSRPAMPLFMSRRKMVRT